MNTLRKMTSSSMFPPLLVLALILLFNVIIQPGFLSVEIRDGRLFGGLITILNRAVPVMLLATGMTLVIATGGADLSVGSVLAVASAVSISLIRGDDASPTADTAMALGLVVIITLIVGIVCGLWNGVLVAKVGMPPVVATLILMVAGRGLTQNITRERSVTTGHLPFSDIANGSTSLSVTENTEGAAQIFLIPYPVWIVLILLGGYLLFRTLKKKDLSANNQNTCMIWLFIKENLLALLFIALGIFGLIARFFLRVPGVPNQIWIAMVVFLLFWLITRRTAFGLFIESVGANRSAANLAGVKATSIIIGIYALSGLCASIAGVLSASNVRVIEPMNTGQNMELDAILAVVLGGTSMRGGKFNLGGSCVGAIILSALERTMAFYGVPVESALSIKAIVIVIVVIIQSPTTRKFLTTHLRFSRKREVATR